MSRKILLLHGYQQNAEIFRTETSTVQKIIGETFKTETKLEYVEAPFDAGETMSGMRIRSWWDMKAIDEFDRTHATLRYVAEILEKNGPFDGFIGFSQGGALAAIVAGLLERPPADRPAFFNTTHPPIHFIVSYSGYREHHQALQPYYENKISTPILHFINSDDPIVTEDRCVRLIERCTDTDGRIVSYSSPFHRIPSSKMARKALKSFLSEVS
ncbi:hypothetical protein COCMIDRAFT_31012 [Bipolaris oryzae ATCC 44560]|uniref:Serine hydrolase domain-containing protein n=1 Tax=Bipolaris oryzae ATCC 44560 TaxID=930090 RepID=W6Z8D6_COCMI|nr:uncharacterized protein COCMIDRAFT_31012 [Bipolaris oryzae ATCC 44560]EUC39956.1 hypothetical protein COCMIDRAFT_31012 [Bipolaris oryzae ATCC 44560]